MPVLRKQKPVLSIVWVIMAVMVSFGLYYGIKWGLKPKPIPVMNPSKFESLEQVGAVVYRRLRQALRQEKIVVIGSAPWLREYDRLWNGFVAAAREDKWQIQVIFEDPSLRPIKEFSDLSRRPLSWPTPAPEMIEDLKKSVQYGHLILVHTTFNHSGHRGQNSLVKELETAFKRPLMAFTMMSLATTAEELDAIQPPCENETAPSNTREYGPCAAAKMSRRYLRKHLDPLSFWAAVDRHGLKDYFIYVHEPAVNISADEISPDVPAPVEIDAKEIDN